MRVYLSQFDLYVTKSGRVFNPAGKLLNKSLTYAGYHTITHKRKQHFVHRLVAFAFIKNPENKPHINHIDGNKINNRVSNLEWCTIAENNRHARQVLKRRNGSVKWVTEGR